MSRFQTKITGVVAFRKQQISDDTYVITSKGPGMSSKSRETIDMFLLAYLQVIHSKMRNIIISFTNMNMWVSKKFVYTI